MTIHKGLGIDGNWIGVHDADPRAIALYRRHYSSRRKSDNHHGFVGVGQKMVLLTVDGRALWVWHRITTPEERDAKEPEQRRARRGNKPSTYLTGVGRQGVMCSVFRNEGPLLSSSLIIEAEQLAWTRWPGQRLFTYVWDAKVASVNPGYCFKKAGWKNCGRNGDDRLTILEKFPSHSSVGAVIG